MNESRLDLYRISCVAVGLIGLLSAALGASSGLMFGIVWDISVVSDEARASYGPLDGVLGFALRGLLAALIAGTPGALLIIYRREVTRRWLLPDTSHDAQAQVGVGRLAFSLLGVFLVVEGVAGLGGGAAEFLWPSSGEALGTAAVVFSSFVAVLGAATVSLSKWLGERLAGGAG